MQWSGAQAPTASRICEPLKRECHYKQLYERWRADSTSFVDQFRNGRACSSWPHRSDARSNAASQLRLVMQKYGGHGTNRIVRGMRATARINMAWSILRPPCDERHFAATDDVSTSNLFCAVVSSSPDSVSQPRRLERILSSQRKNRTIAAHDWDRSHVLSARPFPLFSSTINIARRRVQRS